MEMTSVVLRDRQLVAVSPYELPRAQQEVVDWCRAKILALSADLKEQRENAREAARMLWRNRWPAAIRKTKARMIYYAKLQQALKAGYLIVPNFNVDVVAVRVNRETPREESTYGRAVHAVPGLLPPGQGRYVDDKAVMRDDSFTDTQKDGTKKQVERFTAIGYESEIDFPAALVKPAILQATDRAMALRLFDRIAVVRASRRSDPIVVGQIVDPREKYWAQNTKCVSFFVAWWLDTKDL